MLDISKMDDRELLIRLDEKTNNIIKNQDDMMTAFNNHLTGDINKITKEEAYKAFAPSGTVVTHESEILKIRNTLNVIFWSLFSIGSTLLVGLIILITTGKHG